ncbi:MAG: hypothetical protein H6807_17715 [Planctomycetes bacterium]|nr:hypothetical protein [Planctomycetota bacterium]
MRSPILITVIVVVAAVLGRAQTEEGLRAPTDCWPVSGGSSSRSRQASTRLGLGLQPAWSLESKQGFACEPLVWEGEAVLLDEEKNGGFRLLQVDLASGRTSRHSKTITSTGAASLAIWDRRVFATFVGEGAFGYLRSRSSISQRWQVPESQGAASPILIKDEAFLRVGRAIRLYRWGARTATWSRDGDYIGEFALLGDEIFVLAQIGENCRLDVLDRADGRVRTSVSFGRVYTQGSTTRPRVQVGSSFVFVELPGFAVEMPSGGCSVLLKRTPAASGSSLEILGDLRSESPAIVGAESLFFRGEIGLSERGWMVASAQAYDAVCLEKERPDIMAPGVDPCQVGGRIWLGDLAFEARNGRILRRGVEKVAGSAVPARGVLLFMSADRKRLQAHREIAVVRPFAGARLELAAGRAVLADTDTISGRFVIEPQATVVRFEDAKGKSSEHPLAEVLMIEDGEGRLCYHASEDGLLRALRLLDEETLGEIAYDAARAARVAKAKDLLARFLAEASDLGVDDKKLGSLEKALEDFEKKEPKTDQAKVAALERDRSEKLAAVAERSWRRIEALRDEDFELRIRLLRALFASAPRHGPATEFVRAQLPKEIRPAGDFEAGAWLDLVLAARRRPIRIVIPPAKGHESEADALQRDVGAARHAWRPDLIGVASERLLVLMPPGNPSQLAHCLTVGEMLAEELERMFGGSRESSFPLRIHLFPTRKEYVDFHLKRRNPMAQHSLGNYSPLENISRMFIPDDGDEFADMLSTFVHELTHHWMNVRCPQVTAAAAAKGSGSNGFWVVEGLATMMQEFSYDPRSGEIRREDPGSNSLDTVANCPPQSLLAWPDLLAATQMQFTRLTLNPEPIAGLFVPMTWQLGYRRAPSLVNLFYAQAGAVCHYLYSAENGKYRDRFLAFVGDYYCDRARGWTPEKSFGIDAATLGKAVTDYAKKTVSP